jgi:hypothetical protein
VQNEAQEKCEGPKMSTVKSNTARKKRDFFTRDEESREALLGEMWCHRCMEVAAAIEEPQEFEGNGMVFLEGRCVTCGATIVLEIDE